MSPPPVASPPSPAMLEHAQLAAFLRDVPDRIWFKDRGSRYVAVSQSTLRQHGLDEPAQMIGLTDAAFYPADQAAQFQAGEEQVMTTGRAIIDQVVQETRADGRIAWIVASTLPLRNDQGEIVGTFGIAKDITESRQAELALEQARRDLAGERARLKFIFESLPIGVSLVLPGANESHFVNPAFEQITGIPAADQLKPGAFKRATHPADYARQEEIVKKYKRGEIDHFTLEKRYVHPDGHIVWANLIRRMFTDPLTGQKQSISTVADITERKDAEAKLADTYKKYADASRLAGMAEVATGVLHNVGNVVNSVNVSATLVTDGLRHLKIGSLEKLCVLLREHESDLASFLSHDPKGRRVLEFLESLTQNLRDERDRIAQEVVSLTRNVEHIKEIVAMQQSYATMAGVVEPLDAATLLEDALRMNSAALTRHEVRVIRDFAPAPAVLAERGKVLQILINLIRNAKYACDERGHSDKMIAVKVESAPAGPSAPARVRLLVQDNGVGIPPENLTRIFTHGFTTRAGGHGFGLHSAANAAREMKGSLVALSDGPGRGATFVLELPVAGDQATGVAAIAP